MLNTQLTAEQGADLAARLDGGLSCADAQRELRETRGIELSSVAISRWAAKRRQAKTDLTFARLLETAVASDENATSLPRSKGLSDANVTLLHHAIFAALCNNDQPAVKQAVDSLSRLLTAMAKSRRTDLALKVEEEKFGTTLD